MRLSTNTIKCAAMAIAALALTLGESGQAKAAFIPVGGTPVTGETSLSGGPAGPDPIFVFNFTDVSGDVGHATLNTVASGLGDGSYFATSGSLTMTSPAGVAGTYSLITTPPSPTISPSGLFDVDNLLYPDDNAASAGKYNPVASNYAGGSSISGPSYLDIFGLLFGKPGTEINIYGVGNGAYAFYTEVNGGYNIQQGGGGVVSNLTDPPPPVPEPASLTLLVAGGVSLLGYAGLRRRRSVPHQA